MMGQIEAKLPESNQTSKSKFQLVPRWKANLIAWNRSRKSIKNLLPLSSMCDKNKRSLTVHKIFKNADR